MGRAGVACLLCLLFGCLQIHCGLYEYEEGLAYAQYAKGTIQLLTGFCDAFLCLGRPTLFNPCHLVGAAVIRLFLSVAQFRRLTAALLLPGLISLYLVYKICHSWQGRLLHSQGPTYCNKAMPQPGLR